jgi:hypothetical protein
MENHFTHSTSLTALMTIWFVWNIHGLTLLPSSFLMNRANLTLKAFSTIPHLGEQNGRTKAPMKTERIRTGKTSSKPDTQTHGNTAPASPAPGPGLRHNVPNGLPRVYRRVA